MSHLYRIVKCSGISSSRTYSVSSNKIIPRGRSHTCRLIIPEKVIVQPRLTVGVLVLQAEGLVCAIRYLGFLFQTSPTGVVAEPQEVAVFIGHLTRDADLVAVEVAGYDLLHTSYFELEGFMRAMVCYTCYIYTTLRQFINHQDFLLNNLKTPQMTPQ